MLGTGEYTISEVLIELQKTRDELALEKIKFTSLENSMKQFIKIFNLLIGETEKHETRKS